MVDYKSGVDVDKYRISLMIQVLFFIAGHRNVTVFSDNSVGTKRSAIGLLNGAYNCIGYVMDIEKVMNYNFNPEYTYPLKPGQKPVSRTALIAAWEKLKAENLDKARREYETLRAFDISPAEIEAIAKTGLAQSPRRTVQPAARGGNGAAGRPAHGANQPAATARGWVGARQPALAVRGSDDATGRFKAALNSSINYSAMDGSRGEARLVKEYAPRKNKIAPNMLNNLGR